MQDQLKHGRWKCHNCGEINPGTYLECFRCHSRRLRPEDAERASKNPEDAFSPEKLDSLLGRTRLYSISLPRNFSWEPERALSFLEHILSVFGKATFQIVVEEDRIVWNLVDMDGRAPSTVIQAVRSLYPQAEVLADPYKPPKVDTPFDRFVFFSKQHGPIFAPLKYVTDLKKVDPLSSMVQSLSGLRSNRVIYTLHVSGAIDEVTWGRAVKQTKISDVRKALYLLSDLLSVFVSESKSAVKPLKGTGAEGDGKFDSEVQKVFEDKLHKGRLFNVYLIHQFDMPRIPKEEMGGRDSVLGAMAILDQFSTEYNSLDLFYDFSDDDVLRVDDPNLAKITSTLGLINGLVSHSHPYEKILPPKPMVLSSLEIAALWHLPHEGFAAEEIVWIPSGRAPLPAELAKNKEGALLGHNVFAGKKQPVYMPEKDRETHINIVGKTGVGKSSFMHNLIHQDIREGKGVGVVDPHGKLVNDILRYSIPDSRIDDVVVVDISNEENPPPLNPMIVPGKRNNAAAGQVVAILDKVYNIKAQRAEDSMTAALVTLWKEKTSTVMDVVKLFTNVEFRHRFLDEVDDVVTLDFWEEYESLSPSFQRDLSYPVIHRMRHFYRNPTLRPMMCHPDALDLTNLIENQKIILVSLRIDEGKVPAPEQQLLGTVLVSQLQMAVMSSLVRKTPFFLYIDEVQNFVTTSLEKVFEEALKFGLHLTVANQYLGQLKGKILESVIGNAGATVVFQIGLNDSRLLAPYFQPGFSAEDLVNFPLFNAAVKMRFQGNTMPAFSLQTDPPPNYERNEEEKERARFREALIRKRSVELYTPKTRDDVLKWFDERYPRPKFGRPKRDKGDQSTQDWIVSED